MLCFTITHHGSSILMQWAWGLLARPMTDVMGRGRWRLLFTASIIYTGAWKRHEILFCCLMSLPADRRRGKKKKHIEERRQECVSTSFWVMPLFIKNTNGVSVERSSWINREAAVWYLLLRRFPIHPQTPFNVLTASPSPLTSTYTWRGFVGVKIV